MAGKVPISETSRQGVVQDLLLNIIVGDISRSLGSNSQKEMTECIHGNLTLRHRNEQKDLYLKIAYTFVDPNIKRKVA